MTEGEINSKAPLKGLRVLELSRILAGPWAGQVLADLGADVLKVENSRGDDTRQWGPPFLENADGGKDAAYFHACNRGKRSVVIDFSTADGQAQIRTLAKDADVLIENFKVGGLEKYDLDYESIERINSGIVYCSITGFGQTGPLAKRAGYDFIIQGLSGVMDLTGEPDGVPQKMGVAFADIFTGLYAVIAIQAALAKREKTGVGDYLDLSLLDCMVGVLANQNMNFLATGKSPRRLGNQHPNIAPYETFPSKDRWFILAVGNNDQFGRLCKVLGMQGMHLDARFSSNAARLENRAELHKLIAATTSLWGSDELLSALDAENVPASPINSVEQALNNPQIQARELLLEMQRSSDGTCLPGVRTPIRFLKSELELNNPSPELGSGDLKWL